MRAAFSNTDILCFRQRSKERRIQPDLEFWTQSISKGDQTGNFDVWALADPAASIWFEIWGVVGPV